MQPKHQSIIACHASLSTMQERIRLRQWQQLEHATQQFSSDMVDLTQILETKNHHIPQQELVDLSFQQRRITRMLHNAMLSHRNEIQEVNMGLRHLKQRKALVNNPLLA